MPGFDALLQIGHLQAKLAQARLGSVAEYEAVRFFFAPLGWQRPPAGLCRPLSSCGPGPVRCPLLPCVLSVLSFQRTSLTHAHTHARTPQVHDAVVGVLTFFAASGFNQIDSHAARIYENGAAQGKLPRLAARPASTAPNGDGAEVVPPALLRFFEQIMLPPSLREAVGRGAAAARREEMAAAAMRGTTLLFAGGGGGGAPAAPAAEGPQPAAAFAAPPSPQQQQLLPHAAATGGTDSTGVAASWGAAGGGPPSPPAAAGGASPPPPAFYDHSVTGASIMAPAAAAAAGAEPEYDGDLLVWAPTLLAPP